MKSLLLAVAIAVLLFVAPLRVLPGSPSGSGSAQAADVFSAKIDAAVIAASANGGRPPFLVVLREQADLSPATRLATKREKDDFVFHALQATADRTQPAVRVALDRLGLTYRPYYIVNSFAVDGGGLHAIDELAARGDIARIETDSPVRMNLPVPSLMPQLLPLVTTSIEWGVSKINAPAVWTMGFNGKGIVYANADTGVQWNHPALKRQYRGWNGTSVNHNFNWWDAVHHDVSGNGTNPCGFNLRAPCDDYGHGTHTLGTGIGQVGGTLPTSQVQEYPRSSSLEIDTAKAGNVDHIGVAPGARWIACRNMEQGVGRPSQYIECFQFFLAPWNLNMKHADPNRAADVISNSWTCPLGAPPSGEDCTPDSLRTAVEAERAAGIFVVASAGNSGGGGCSTVNEPPAIYDATVTAGATDINDNLAGFSSLGPVTVDGSNRIKPDLVAPGVNVRSSYPGGRYANMSGTSMSAPHLAGAVALLWSAHPELIGKVSMTEGILSQAANRLVVTARICGGTSASDIPNNLFGYGRVDVLAAVNSLH